MKLIGMKRLPNKCGCALCEFYKDYRGPLGGWCDPRRYYSESEEDFIIRVPNGFLRWPENHVDYPIEYEYYWDKDVN